MHFSKRDVFQTAAICLFVCLFFIQDLLCPYSWNRSVSFKSIGCVIFSYLPLRRLRFARQVVNPAKIDKIDGYSVISSDIDWPIDTVFCVIHLAVIFVPIQRQVAKRAEKSIKPCDVDCSTDYWLANRYFCLETYTLAIIFVRIPYWMTWAKIYWHWSIHRLVTNWSILFSFCENC